jgi:hypothetical protein
MRRFRLPLFAVALGAAAIAVNGPAAGQSQTRCAATFHVQHNDRIGSLRLPEGAYRITTTRLSCLRASRLFTEFLQDWNGRLPRPWSYDVEGRGHGTFDAGRASFEVERTGAVTPDTPGHPGQGGGSHGDLACPGTFEVEHNDRIGGLRLPQGNYRITPLGARLSCARASRLFARFLQRPSGRLPGDWVLLPELAEFVNDSSFFGFRVKRVRG